MLFNFDCMYTSQAGLLVFSIVNVHVYVHVCMHMYTCMCMLHACAVLVRLLLDSYYQ